MKVRQEMIATLAVHHRHHLHHFYHSGLMRRTPQSMRQAMPGANRSAFTLRHPLAELQE